MNTFLTANFVDLFQAKDLVDMVSEAAKKKNKLLEKFIAVMMKVASYLIFFICIYFLSTSLPYVRLNFNFTFPIYFQNLLLFVYVFFGL